MDFEYDTSGSAVLVSGSASIISVITSFFSNNPQRDPTNFGPDAGSEGAGSQQIERYPPSWA